MGARRPNSGATRFRYGPEPGAAQCRTVEMPALVLQDAKRICTVISGRQYYETYANRGVVFWLERLPRSR